MDLQKEMAGIVLHHGDLTAQVRPTLATSQESILLNDLREYHAKGTDRRMPQLEAYLNRRVTQGQQSGAISTIVVEYYKAPNYGRLLARGPSAQKLTKDQGSSSMRTRARSGS